MDDDEILEGEIVDDDQLSAQAELLSGAGLLSEEIDIFDIAATEGPAYESMALASIRLKK